MSVPEQMIDASDITPVPDNQEVHRLQRQMPSILLLSRLDMKSVCSWPREAFVPKLQNVWNQIPV
jgi:hypothetical protein